MSSNTEYALLYVCIDNDSTDLLNKYKSVVDSHNKNAVESEYPDSGFDLFCPEEKLIGTIESTFVSMKIKCEMRLFNKETKLWKPTGYYLYPRSSISKTPLMLANQTGIIDSGYRGSIIGAFRNISGGPVSYKIEKNTRLLQICAPDLRPIIVQIVDEKFFEKTKRGDGGFGSTGN